MSLSKKITVSFAIVYLLGLGMYASMIIGTFVHEYGHAGNAIDLDYVTINYDGSGKAVGSFYKHGHEWTYLRGYLVESLLIGMTVFNILVLINYGGKK